MLANHKLPQLSAVLIIFLAFAALTPFKALSAEGSPEMLQARTWAETYLANAAPEDLELIANLFYWSYERSMSTLRAQEAAIDSLEATWQSWLNISGTRLNPSRKLPYELSEKIVSEAAQKFDAVRTEHRKIGLTYATCTNYIISQKNLNNHIREGVEIIRTDARKIISQALVSSVLWKRNGGNKEDDSISALQKFWRSLPQKAISSFVDLDERYNSMSATYWQTFMVAHDKANKLWQTIEESRANFYLSYYQAVYENIAENHSNILPLRAAFDRHGYIESGDRKKLLPNPQ